MKISAAIFVASVTSTSAFVLPSARSGVFNTRLFDKNEASTEEATERAVIGEDVVPDENPLEEPVISENSAGSRMSESLPFMEANPILDGSMAGDVQFDPLGFAKTEEDLMNYREAEIKHARLAMLAAAGWPISELADKQIANALGLQPLLDSSDRAPSVLNGGLGKVSPLYWVGCLVAAAAIDVYGISKSKQNEPGYFPGNLGFDPLGVYPQDEEGQKWMQTAEIKNGRLAMIAITAFAFQEFTSNLGVVDETPAFFKPVGTVMSEATNAGYIIH